MRIIKWIFGGFIALVVFAFVFSLATTTNSYQTVEQRQEKVDAERARRPSASPTWSYSPQVDPMGKGVTHVATLVSTNTFSLDFPYKGEQRAMIMIRKSPRLGNDVILEIQQGQIVCGYPSCTVPVRFDQENTQNFTAAGSADFDPKVIFIRNYDGFVQKMLKAKTVRIAPTIYQAGSIPMEFAVTGFDQAKFESSH